MPRQLRIEYEGAMYHVMARGDRRESIFQDDDDRREFIRTLGETCERTGWRVYAWVLMNNHYHLVMETPEANLVKGMQWFQTTWTVRYNTRHRMVGHVFGGRYKAVLVEPAGGDRRKVWRMGGYIGAVIDYVHLNPVRAGIITRGTKRGLLDYEWSSLKKAYTVEASKRAAWMDVKRGLDFLNLKDQAAGRRKYLEYLERRMREEEAERCGGELPDGQTMQSTLNRGWYFGSQGFREELLGRLGKVFRKRTRRENYEGAEVKRSHGEAEAERLLVAGAARLGLDLGERERAWGDNRPILLAKLIKERTTVGNGWIAEKLWLKTPGNVSQQLFRIGRLLEGNKELQRQWKQLQKV